MSYTATVREFTIACQDKLPAHPVPMSADQIAFIQQMVNDEMQELATARSITEQADALVDAIYYLCDCAVKHGMNLDPLFMIVHKANMGKVVDGKVVRREDGKIMKPLGWRDPKPLLDHEITRQLSEGSF